MSGGMFERPNHIHGKRDKFYKNHTQGAADPTYLKEPTDKVVFGVAVGGMTVGVMTILSGLYSMSFGVNKHA
jgi:hypothetical protein